MLAGIYQVALTHQKLGITKDILVTKVIPHLLPLAFDNNLNINQVHVHSAHRHVLTTSYIIVVLLLCGVLQFNAYMKVIHDMLRRAESEQETKLQQLSAIEQEQKSDCSASLVLTYPSYIMFFNLFQDSEN